MENTSQQSLRWLLASICILTSVVALAQSPDRLNYQAVVRNSSGSVVSNQSIGMRVTLLKGSATGTAVYTETHTKTTNASGLLSLEIGGGTIVSGSFASIPWGQGPYFIKTETDVAGGTNYQLTSTSQLLSVPFSLYAQSAALKYSSSGDTLFSGKEYVIVPGLSTANANAVVTGSPSVTTSVASAVTTVSASLGGEVINAGASTVTSRGICYATTASPTILNSTVASGAGTGSFTTNLPGLNPATTYYARAYATNGTATSYGNQVSFTTLGAAGQACAQGSTLTVTHTAGDVAPVTKTVTYKLVQTDLSGESKCWIAQNLGAERQAISVGDFSEQSAGWYWQFNRKQGYSHDGIFTRKPSSSWISNISEDLNWNISNDPCNLLLGTGWRIPLNLEWNRVRSNGLFYLGGNNYNFYSSSIRIHSSGYLKFIDGIILERGISGFYWSSNQGSSDFAYLLNIYNINGGGADIFSLQKSHGFAIRCIKD